MAKTCAMHGEVPAVAACHRCRKPLCRSCVMVTPAGTFCSAECGLLAREDLSMGDDKGKKKGGGMMTKLVLVVVLVVIGALVGVHFASPNTEHDYLGKILKLMGRGQ